MLEHRSVLGRGNPHVHQDSGRKKHRERQRQEPSNAPCPEVEQRYFAGAVQFTIKVRGDEVAGNDEEDINADKATAERPGAQMVDDD